MKAVIVENDSAIRSLLAAELTAFGHDVVRCSTEAEVRSVLGEALDTLLFINLDEACGTWLAFCRSLRDQRERDTTWIIALTAEADLIEPAFSAGASDVLLKPVNSAAARVRILLAGREMERLCKRREEEQATGYRLCTRAQQQVAVAALGEWALANVNLEVLIGQAILFVAQMLEVDCCGFWELLAGRQALMLRDGAGWLDGHIGLAIPADSDSAEGQAMQQGPVIVQDWLVEERFRMPALLQEHHLRSSLVVPVAGAGAPAGVLAAHTTSARKFSEDDIHFLQAIGVLLSLAIARKRSEESIQRLAAFARCNPNPVLELNASGQLSYANEAAEEMARSFGYDAVLELLPENVAQIIRSALTCDHGPLQERAVRGRRTLTWTFFPLSAGQTVHCYAEEITSKLELETQLRQLQKMECVGQLAAGLAHDYNNVLTIIRGHAEMLLNEQTFTAGGISSLNRILGAVERASNITRQLLTFSRRDVVQTVPLNLNECIGNIVKILDHVLGERIQLVFEPARDVPSVLGDSGMLDQVVMNLAINARDAMTKGGRLVLTTSLVEVDGAHVRRQPEARTGKYACLSVSDTGCGIDADVLSHIFEPFFTTKEIGKGTGLGLATVYGIVKQHHGWIEVNSRVGQGTTFLIFLPCTELVTPRGEADSRDVRPVSGATILLVDDEASLRELARMLLHSHGYQVLEASSALEALKIWAKKKDRIDLLLTDLIMPDGMTGLELGQRLASEKPSLKIVYTSGYSSDVIGKKGIRQQIRFLQKPYPAQTLTRTVREALDGSMKTQPCPGQPQISDGPRALRPRAAFDQEALETADP